jgi:hypothetical protein
MNLPIQAEPVERKPAGTRAWSGVEPQDNLCQCQYGSRMCSENRTCACVDGYPRCEE